jgi:molecular chaperone HtpG
MDDCEEILPQWMRFLRGVIDSDNLPLNVSRELLQDSAAVRAIKKQIIKRTLDVLDEMAKDRPADYAEFWKSFGAILKEGLAVDSEQKERLSTLVRFDTTHESGLTSLADYVARMPEKQEAIYYVFGPSKTALAGSPYLEGLRARGFEVLYLTDPVDEWAAAGIGEFQGKKLVSAMRADVPLSSSEEETAKKAEATTALGPLTERIAKILSEHVREVKISERLTDSPCCLVLASGASPAFMEQLLKSSGRPIPRSKRIFEINPTHPVIQNLNATLARKPDAPELDQWIEVLYQQALLAEGSAIEDPNRFAKQIATLLTQATTTAPAA